MILDWRYNQHFPPAVKLALDQAEELEVYSLEPHPKLKQGGERRWDCKVLGKTTIKNPDSAQEDSRDSGKEHGERA